MRYSVPVDDPQPAGQPIIELLRRALGSDDHALLLGPDIPFRHHADWSRLPPTAPLALARPGSVAQVSELLRACHSTFTPVVPQGGLTGLVGGAHPVEGCVALSLERLAGIEEIDSAGATMTVRAGTPLEVAQAAASDAGLLLPLDLGSRGSCTVGGNLATNAGGNRVVRYGPARDNVLGLEVVLADGTVLESMNKLVKNNTGYDLKHLFIGSEGTLGVITRAVLRLQARPASISCALCAVARDADLLPLLASLRARLGPALTAFEAMWPDFWVFMVERLGLRSPFAAPHGAYALVEASGFGREGNADDLLAALADSADAGRTSDILVAQAERDAAAFWRIREGVSELRRWLGAVTSFDVGLPGSEAAGFAARITKRLRARWAEAVVLVYGHLGDNNLHVVVHVPPAGSDQPKAEIDEIVYSAIGEIGGSISAEHGIGLTKRRYLPLSRSPAELATMRSVKAALDPRGIMNPGKIVEAFHVIRN